MPRIDQLLSGGIEGFSQDEHPEEAKAHVPTLVSPVKRSPFLRCPTPPQGPISVDDLDQFELKGLVPQYRVLIKQ